ncbi:MAG: hypothetical protein ACLQMT_08985 [Candidatus Acidiferrales bacterium]
MSTRISDFNPAPAEGGEVPSDGRANMLARRNLSGPSRICHPDDNLQYVNGALPV